MQRPFGHASPTRRALRHGHAHLCCGEATTPQTCLTASQMGAFLTCYLQLVLWGTAPSSVLAALPSRLIPGDHRYRLVLRGQPHARAHAEAT
jgi:hypothetical protein